MSGLYGYWDNIKKRVIYIGQAKDIERRLNAHMNKSRYDAQPINQILQNNPERYESFILADGEFTTDELNELEYEAVEMFKTNRYKYPENEGFNFRDGGNVYKYSEESKRKMSKSHKGKEPWNKGKTGCYSEETLQKKSESMKGKNIGYKHSEESKQKMSESKKGENNPMYNKTGEKHHLYKDNVPSGEKLYEEWKSGLSQRQLGKKYNCSDNCIGRRIKRYKKELEGNG